MHYFQYAPFTVLTLVFLLSGCKDDDGNASGGDSKQTPAINGQQADTGAPAMPEVYDNGDLLLVTGEQDAHTLDLVRFIPGNSISLTEARMDGDYDNVCHSLFLSSGWPELVLTADSYGLCHLILTFVQAGRSYTRPLSPVPSLPR